VRFREAEKAEVWDSWQGGEVMRSIARRLGRESSLVRTMIEDTGGVRPARRRRALRCLSLTEREEISRGVAAGESLRQIARRSGRARGSSCFRSIMYPCFKHEKHRPDHHAAQKLV
jgi:hypothetical protein